MDDLAYALETMEDLKSAIESACEELKAVGIALGAESLLEQIAMEKERVEREYAEEERREIRALHALYEGWIA